MQEMSKNQKQSGFVHIVLTGIVLAVIIIGILFLLFINSSTREITNEGYTYSVVAEDFHADASDGKSYLVSDKESLIVAIAPYADNKQLECGSKTTKVSSIEINKRNYDLCKENNSTIHLAAFSEEGKWHVVMAWSPDNQPVDLDILSSALNQVVVRR